MKEIKIYESLYDTDISFLIGGTVSDIKKFLKKRHGENLLLWDRDRPQHIDQFLIEDTDGYQFHVEAPLGEGERFYAWAHKASDNILFHETLHITFDILFTRGVVYSDGSEEAFAYLGASIFEKLKEKL